MLYLYAKKTNFLLVIVFILSGSAVFTKYFMIPHYAGVSAPALLMQLDDPRVDLQGHRGSRGLRPENTWPAFETAILNGMTTIETDLNLTKDKEFIIHHNFKLNRRTCRYKDGGRVKPIAIADLTVKDLKKLDCGFKKNKKFPEQVAIKNTPLITLDEFFEMMRRNGKKNDLFNKVKFNLELKVAKKVKTEELHELADLLVKKIIAYDMSDRAMVQSFNHKVLTLVKNANPNLETSALFRPKKKLLKQKKMKDIALEGFKIIERALTMKVESIGINHKMALDSIIIKAQEEGIKVTVWTVNDYDEILHFLQLNIDGIITDYPDRLNNVWQIYEKIMALDSKKLLRVNPLNITTQDMIQLRILDNEINRDLVAKAISFLVIQR